MIPRHKTAIRRPDLSRPVRCLLRDGLLDPSKRLFDYGCGHGQDIDFLAERNITCDGWDPFYRADTLKTPSPIINLGYVLNVIEDPVERAEVLQQAWDLCQEVLVVSALGMGDPAEIEGRARYNDGILTSRGTFQKYYSHQELRAYLQELLPVDAVAAAPNIFYLFKSEAAQQQLLSRRYRRPVAVPRKRVSEQLFEQYKDLLDPFMAALSSLGRLPGPEEFPDCAAVEQALGSLKRALQIILRVTGKDPWEEITARRREDLLVYLALARFGTRRPLSALPLATQRDVKAFMGTYNRAREEANTLLFSVGNTDLIDQACRTARLGRLVENALVIRRSAIEELPPTLRVFEGCARVILGEVDEANVVKLHRYSGKVTYLVCHDIDRDPDPEVSLRIKVGLRALSIDIFDYSTWTERPRLNIDLTETVNPDP